MNIYPIQYIIPIPRWGIKNNILTQLWANPIPNSNSRVLKSDEGFLKTYMLNEQWPNLIHNSNSEVGYQREHTDQDRANPIPNPNSREPK